MTEPKQHPLVSVIIPVFNGARYIGEAIHSVLAQIYSNVELIVIDDGSTDKTSGIVQSFGDRVRYQTQPNTGSGAARNRGVELARAEFLTFLDADDLWLPDKLERQMAFFAEQPEIEAVSGMVEQFVSPELSHQLPQPPELSRPMPGAIPSAIAIRRQALARVGEFATQWKVGEFADWYARAVEAGLRLMMLPAIVARRRLHLDNQGVRHQREVSAYAQILKQSLDRRRAQSEQG